MRKMNSIYTTRILLSALLFTTVSCVDLKPRADNTRYFVLGSASSSQAKGNTTGREVLGIRSVSIASYLDTPRIATRVGDVEISYSSANRWAEDLEPAIRNRIADLILASGSVGEVITLPWPDNARPTLKLDIHIGRFEGTSDSEASLSAAWSLQNAAGTVLQRGVSERQIPGWIIGDYTDLVLKLDHALGQTAEEIVVAIRANS